MIHKISYNGLSLYPEAGGEPYSRDDLPITSPFRVTVEGLIGGCLVKRCFLHNDNPSLYFTDISVQFIDTLSLYSTGNSIYDWSRKMIYAVHEPVPEEWAQVTNHNSLSFGTIGTISQADTFSYFPIWIRCYIPSGLQEQNIVSLPLSVAGAKRLVGY